MAQLAELLLLFRVASLPALALGALLGQVRAVSAPVPDGPVHRRVEIDQVRADRVQERPVVARHDHHSRHAAELLLYEHRGGIVQVVGGLVQQQRGGPSDQQRRQGEPPALPARQRRKRAPVRHAPQAEPAEDDLCAPVGVPGVALLRLVEPGPVRFEQSGVVRGLGERPGEPVELGQVRTGLSQGVVEHVSDRGVAGERRLLMQEAQVGGPHDGAGVRLVHSGQQPQQGGLARTVLADQPDPVAGCGGERDAVEHAPRAQRPYEIAGEQRVTHRRAPRSPAAARRTAPASAPP
ncbi:hypothetical protein GCM10010404_35400 [Nonomuraea africana]|uniref:Secreted protein n=1 Tax=Nonomuraea africana TaxID=46171 RepID=A0ABR9KSE9_9ACTN|nr:hypothetical protein [Nonomuraea africana]